MPSVATLSRAVALSAVLVLVAGCSPSTSPAPAGSAGNTAGTSAPSPTATPAVLSFSPVDAATDVSPAAPVQVRAASGSLTEVTVTDAAGATIPGELSGSTWTSAKNLKLDTAYTIKATASGSDGTAATTTSSFRTLKPKATAGYDILYDGWTLGVGMPVDIQFVSQVETKAMRAEVEKRVKVTVTPAQEGSWGWLDNRQLLWRPKNYWQPGTKVSVEANLQGVQTGAGKWVDKDKKGGFSVGSSVITTVDMVAHTMTVRKNGQVVRTMPTSTGKPGFETRSGVKVILEKHRNIVMDAASLGVSEQDPDYYKIPTEYAMRVTWTGEFLHAAPWSVGQQGHANVSHGCTHLSPGNAAWMYDLSKVGDVVVYTGTSRIFKTYEGMGVWQLGWSQWQQRSAVTAADAGASATPTPSSSAPVSPSASLSSSLTAG